MTHNVTSLVPILFKCTVSLNSIFILWQILHFFLCINILTLFFLLFYLFILMRNRFVLILDFWFYSISISTRLFEKCWSCSTHNLDWDPNVGLLSDWIWHPCIKALFSESQSKWEEHAAPPTFVFFSTCGRIKTQKMLLTEDRRLRTGEVLEQIRANPLPQTLCWINSQGGSDWWTGNKEIKATLD